ncbi:MAG: sodium:proton antiporter [Prevotellaceae bacterium]|nr:sodium:proton antiporter [Candidatus Colivivens equi]
MKPSPYIAIIPIILLIGLISLTVSIFGANSIDGGSQISMLFAAACAATLSMSIYKMPWKIIEQGICKSIGNTSSAIIILLLIGMISGTWMISGIIPTCIYYGVQIVSPQMFLVSCCLISAIMSVMTGSSWTTIATIGVALLGIGHALGISSAWAAGAIISGAYFGDKISPLSDTTVLASSTSEVTLFSHIQYMLLTTIPSFVLGLIIFLIAGFTSFNDNAVMIDEVTQGLSATFNISGWVMIVPIIVGVMIVRKVPALITLLVASILAIIASIIVQPDVLFNIGEGNMVKGIMLTCFGHTQLDTGSVVLNDLISTNGMSGMLNTIWLILCALTFGGVMMSTGMIQSITSVIIKWVRGRVSLVSSTVFTGLLANIVTSDQYLSIIITASMFKGAYKKLGFEGRLLSRTTEDAVTVTSVLIPWNSCGLTQATILGVPTIAYMPYCFFNYISPLMSIFVAIIGWNIKKVTLNQIQGNHK